MATSPVYPSGVAGVNKTIVTADTTNWVTLYDNSAGSAAVRLESLNLCSDDTATVNIQIGVEVSAVQYLIGTARAITLSGTDGAAAIINALNIVGNVSPDAIKVIYIPVGGKLVAKSLLAVTATKTVTLTGWVRQYA
jgi:hypothetical protein